MKSRLLRDLETKSITKEDLLQKVEHDPSMLPEILNGISSSKPTVRYGCASVLTNLSYKHPEKLYPHMDSFIALLESKHRILIWNAIGIIANLTKVDKDKKFDAIFPKYYGFLNDEHMVTVANVVGHSGKIALAKPYLAQKIAHELLKVERISTTPHLTDECRRVIAEKAIESFDMFLDRIRNKKNVIAFARKQLESPRKTLRIKAENFLKKWNQQSS